jgi:transcriptional regulator with XRE-family HTH domain
MTDGFVNYGGWTMALCCTPMPQKETMGQRIKRRLQELPGRPSQADMARELGVGRATVSQWVLDQSKPTPEHLLRLADYLGMDVHHLVFGPEWRPDDSGASTGRFRAFNRRFRI